MYLKSVGSESIIGTFIALFTALTTYQGLSKNAYQKQYYFHVDKILIEKQYFRLISSGFLHVSWLHFAFNIIALLAFAQSIETILGWQHFLLIYFASMLGGSLLSLYIHRNHGDYTSVGASGAISGIVAASIMLFPDGEISLILIPIGIKSWIFGLLYILISILGIKSQNDDIGHEAHLGGIITGILSIALLKSDVFIKNWWAAAIMLAPVMVFFTLIKFRPDILITGKWNINPPKLKTKKSSDKSLNYLLDKISKKGIDSLSANEKKLLEQYKDKL